METLQKEMQKQIGTFVAEDYRTAAIFSQYGIDFCCKGNRTIDEVCQKNNIDSNELIGKLLEVSISAKDQAIDYK